MEIDLKLDNESLFRKVQRNMLTLLKNPVFEEKGKLPPEADLAQMLGVSRTVLRDVLANLESHGFISRRRGIGTTINYHILNAYPRLDIDQAIDDIIRESGYTPTLEYFRYDVVQAGTHESTLFHLKVGDPLIYLERLMNADKKPAIYSVETFSKKLIMKPYEPEELQDSILTFIEEKCNLVIETDMAKVRPLQAGLELGRKMKISSDTMLLHLDEINFDLNKRPVLWTREYFVADIINFNVMRRNLL